MVAPASPPIKPAEPCACRVEHMPDGSGSRVMRSPDCPQHAHLLKPQAAPMPLPYGLASVVTPEHIETGLPQGDARDEALRRRQDELKAEWERIEAVRQEEGRSRDPQ